MNRTFNLLGVILLCACQSQAKETNDAPAVIVDSDSESRAELQQIVSGALHDAPVQLADDALTDSSLLVIERRQIRTLEGRIGDDRTMDAPEQFRLVVNESRCVLIHVRTGVRHELTHTRCRAI